MKKLSINEKLVKYGLLPREFAVVNGVVTSIENAVDYDHS